MRLAFTKMQGLGNDFIVFEAPAEGPLPTAAALRSLADRRTGIGFDQALVLAPPRAGGTDVFYRIFNSDGSEVEQCANGARCIASLVARKLGRSKVQLDSAGGRVAGELHADGNVSLDMGEPNFDPASLPFEASREADIYPLRVGEKELQIGAVSMGNPHAVIQVPTCAPRPWTLSARLWRIIPAFLAARTSASWKWSARSTSGCASTSAARARRRRAARALAARWRSGAGSGCCRRQCRSTRREARMTVRWAGPGEHLWLTGPAVSVFEGTVDVPDDRESSQAEA